MRKPENELNPTIKPFGAADSGDTALIHKSWDAL